MRVDPITKKLATVQVEELITDLSACVRDGVVSKVPMREWAGGLSTEKLVAYTSAIAVLLHLLPILSQALAFRPAAEVKAIGDRRMAEQEVQRAAMVAAGGHDAL